MNKLEFQVRCTSLAIIIGLIGACAATPYPEATPQTPDGQFSAPTVPSIPPFESSGHDAIDTWRNDFAKRAIREGRNPAIVYDVLRDAKPLEAYLPKNPDEKTSDVSDQAEFSKPIWDYLRTAASENRKTNGAGEVDDERALFEQIEAAYGVDKHVVAAIWGMETNFGGHIGNFDGPETLVNMAAEGRRVRLAESELLATMKILEQGLATREQLIAGWAGAMGQTQFMPSTYLAHAVDFTGDGKRDVWSSKADALASAANYLSSLGYVPDEPWGIEIIVPGGFDFGLSDGTRRDVSDWVNRGATPIRGGDLSELAGGPNRQARLWLPAGATGPKFLLFSNFDIFLRYNRSNSYALGVGMLADGISGQHGPVAPWPTGLAILSKAEVKQMQAGLNKLGYSAGPVDGVVGNGTRAALLGFQKAQGGVADGYPTPGALAAVLAAAG